MSAAALIDAQSPASVVIDVDTKMATRLLAIACSQTSVDAAEFRSSQLLELQLAHHRRFGEVYTIDNYLAGLHALSTCKVPAPDPFRMRYLVQDRAKMAAAITFLDAQRSAIGRDAAALIAPYVPNGFDFSGSVVLAPASFSRGGFARGGAFFIDIPGLAGDIEADYEPIVRLIAHETYHAVQEKLVAKRPPGGKMSPSGQAIRNLFDGLIREGTATFVGDPMGSKRVGAYGKFDQDEAARGLARLPQTASMLDFAVELLKTRADEDRTGRLYGLVFGGGVGQPGYYLGQQMAAEIAGDFGAGALPCLLQQQPEYFVLAYDRAYRSGTPLKGSVELGAGTIDAAQMLAGSEWEATLATCTAPVARASS